MRQKYMFKWRFFILLMASLNTVIYAQKVDLKYYKNFKPRSIGPAGMSGRVTAIDVLQTNTNRIWIGTASGGVWYSNNGGVNFQPIFDKEAVQAIGAVVVNQNNPDEIWVGTGEGNPRNSQSSGAGIYKSIDGGKTWQLMGLENTKTIYRIHLHKDDPNTVYVASLGSAWGPSDNRGVFKTTNGGKTWDKILYVNELTGCADLAIDANNPNKLIAAMWEYERKPYFFNSGGKGSGLYLTYDAGKTWKRISDKNGLPKGDLGRIGVAISRSHPNIVYALVEAKKRGLYKSEDGGENWKLVSNSNIGNRPFYYSDIRIDPKNPNKIWNLYSLVSLSIDGGKNFEVVMPYYGYHPDHHAFYIHPDNPDFIINGNDGGLNISHDGGNSWRFAENLPLGQFYHINYDMQTPYNVYGGMQDNGSWRGPAYVWKNGGIRNAYWKELVFGDGFDVVPIPNRPNEGYAMYQGGNLYRYSTNEIPNHFIQPFHPEDLPLRFNWNAGIAIDPFNDDGLYFGSQFLHYSSDNGDSWSILSPDLTTNDSEKQKQSQSGGLTIDATRAENHTTILSIAPSPLNQNIIWVGTDDGNIQLTKDKGQSWQKVSLNIAGFPQNAWVAQLVASSINENEVFAVVNNYRQNDWKPYLYHSKDLGVTWKNLANADLPIYTLSVAQDLQEENLLFVGTEFGLYFTIDYGDSWTKWDIDYPSVSTYDLKIHPRESDLIIGTFGRAIYILDNIAPLRKLAHLQKATYRKSLEIFEIPTAYLVDFKPADGVRFAADANFLGQNRPSGARISFWADPVLFEKEVPKSEDETDSESTNVKKDKKKDQKAVVRIFDEKLDSLRKFETKPDTGYNLIVWDLKKDGLHWPSYKKRKEDAIAPSGFLVSPGKYLVVIDYKDKSDSNWVEVKQPENGKLIYSSEILGERILLMHKKILNITDRLNESQTLLDRIAMAKDDLEKSLRDSLMKEHKIINDSIKAIYNVFLIPKDFDGYDHVTERISNLLSRAYAYYNSGRGGAEQQLELCLAALDKQLTATTNRVNTFYQNDWQKWHNFILDLNLSFSKPFEEIK